ncbi:MAG: aldo/keto reductase [Acidobacteriota bacterium]
MSQDLNRRDFLKTALVSGGIGAAGLTGAGRLAEAADGAKTTGTPALSAKVPRKTLGKTGEQVPILLQGCAMTFDARYDKILHTGFKEGVDYLDTALVYARGESQKTIAPFLKQVGRENVWITTKAPHRRNQADVASFETDLDTCLTDLGTKQVELFFMHALNDAKYVTKQYAKMGDRLKKKGKIKHFGFSCHDGNVVELMEKAAKLGGIDVIMFRYHFGKYGDKELNRAIDACKKANIGLIAMKTQKSVPDDLPEVASWKGESFNLAQAKLKAVWADERIDSAVSHMDTLEKLQENVAAAKTPLKLSVNELHQLNRLAERTAQHSCEGCNHRCEPEVDGEVKIADTLRFLMYDECYGETDKARQFYRELTPAQRAFDGLDFTRAMKACPEGIDIPTRLAHARSRLA